MRSASLTATDIINFIQKAMENNLDIYVRDKGQSFTIWNLNNDISIYIWGCCYDNQKEICIECSYLNTYRIKNVSELDYSSFCYLGAIVEEYSKNKTVEYFNNFFKDEDSKPTNIDDLDDKEDQI